MKLFTVILAVVAYFLMGGAIFVYLDIHLPADTWSALVKIEVTLLWAAGLVQAYRFLKSMDRHREVGNDASHS